MCKLVVVVYHEVVVGILHSSLDLASSAACIFQRLFFWIYHLLHKLRFDLAQDKYTSK